MKFKLFMKTLLLLFYENKTKRSYTKTIVLKSTMCQPLAGSLLRIKISKEVLIKQRESIKLSQYFKTLNNTMSKLNVIIEDD